MYQHIPTNRPITGIEIGVWEAHNSVRLLDKFPNLHITLIDPFEGYQDWWGFIDGSTMKGHEYIAFERLKPYVDRVNIIKHFSDKALEFIAEAKQMVAEGAKPEEVLHYEFGLEPDYMFDLM